jgi:hypothetical protein
MNGRTPEQLRIILSVALALVPRHVRRDFADRVIAKTDPAKAEIVARLASELNRHFVIEEKPQRPVEPPRCTMPATVHTVELTRKQATPSATAPTLAAISVAPMIPAAVPSHFAAVAARLGRGAGGAATSPMRASSAGRTIIGSRRISTSSSAWPRSISPVGCSDRHHADAASEPNRRQP